MAAEWMDEFRRTSYENWQATAPGWERLRTGLEETTAVIREWMLRALAPQSGQTLLELAAGAGETGFEAARLVGERGRVISTDFSPAMVEVARRRARELGIENVEHRVMDAERMDLDTDSVDGVLCRFGYMLMADPAAAFAETRRVLRPGGRVALAVWGPPERNPVFGVLGRTLVQAGLVPPPQPDRPGQFSMASEERIRGQLEAAGFTDARVEELPARFWFADIGDYLELVADSNATIAALIDGLPEEEQAAIEGRLEEGFAPFRGDDGYKLSGVALGAVAS